VFLWTNACVEPKKNLASRLEFDSQEMGFTDFRESMTFFALILTGA
jgi:hypothetical protein